jgi:CPA2 family monovalent cation:H+ antiporter-2
VLPKTALQDHTILVGYGRVGSRIGAELMSRDEAFLVIEESDAVVAQLRKDGLEVIGGSVGDKALLDAANVAGAKCLIVAIPSPFEASSLIASARAVNSGIEIVARAHSLEEVEHLRRYGADHVVLSEEVTAHAMAGQLFREDGLFAGIGVEDRDGDAFENAQKPLKDEKSAPDKVL